MPGTMQGLAPDHGGADIGGGLHEDRQEQPGRMRRSHELDEPLERAEMQDDENEGKKAEETGNPRQDRAHARYFPEETRARLSTSSVSGSGSLRR